MPELIDGEWVRTPVAASETRDGAFHREPTHFRDWIGPAEAASGRYQLFVSNLCPWAARTVILRRLKGLEAIVPLAVAGPVIGADGWVYEPAADAGPALGPVREHYRLYTATVPRYSGKSSVPVLWDRVRGRIVNNESADIVRMLNSAFDHLTGNRLDFYPEPLRAEIDRWNALLYEMVNNGVYRAGFATSQDAHDTAVGRLFKTLDVVDGLLAGRRYLAGPHLTEADWRLFVTLIRFDVAYHGAFKCNLRRIEDYPNLSNYLRELYQWPGVRETVNLADIKRGYYTNPAINPSLIVPQGPAVDFDRPHDRDRLPGQGVWQRAP